MEAAIHEVRPSARNPAIDALRAISMLYIVGFWHLFDYGNVRGFHHVRLTYTLVVLALGMFVFVSGYLAGGASPGSAIAFYKRRFWRIYPPFLFASILFLAVGFGDQSAILRGMAGLGMLIKPPPPTLWFICMLLVFYSLTPLLLAANRSAVLYVLVTGLIVTALLVYRNLSGLMDERLLLYFPAFAAGIFVGRRGYPQSAPALPLLISLAAVSLVILHNEQGLEFNLWSVPWTVFGSIAVFAIVCRALQNAKPSAVIYFISYASFFMYLLHRVVIKEMMLVWFPESTGYQLAYLVVLVLPVVLAVGWLFQRGYDWFLSNYIRENGRKPVADAVLASK